MRSADFRFRGRADIAQTSENARTAHDGRRGEDQISVGGLRAFKLLPAKPQPPSPKSPNAGYPRYGDSDTRASRYKRDFYKRKCPLFEQLKSRLMHHVATV